jgi:serine/threonine protein kinase
MFTPKKITKDIFIKSRYGNICNEYTIVSKIGEGTYGNVYKAFHKQSNNPRAIKILKTSKGKNIEHQKALG